MKRFFSQLTEGEWCLILLFVLIGFHVGTNLWWLRNDNHTVRTDEEGHMQLARTYYEKITADHPNLILKLIDIARIKPGNPAHPPLLHICGALCILLFGYSLDTIAFTNTLAFIAVILGCYKLLRLMLRPWHALYATFVISFTPIVFASSRFFMTDFLSLALIVWALYALMRSEYFHNTRWSFLFGLLNGLAILARTTSPLYYFFPVLLTLIVGVSKAWPRARWASYAAWRGLSNLAFNSVLVALITLAVAAPWYVRHLDTFYTYWTAVHAGGGGPLALVDLPAPKIETTEQLVYTPQRAPAAVKSMPLPTEADKKNTAAPQEPQTQKQTKKAPSLLQKIVHPRVPWLRYPVYTINNAVFLPTFLLGLLGVILVFLYRRQYTYPYLILAAWLFGSYVLLTIALKYATPRYTLQAIPALSVFAALAVMSPRNPWLQRLCTGAFAGWLFFQFVNLTFFSYGALARWEIPMQLEIRGQREYNDNGLVIYKGVLSLGFSYAYLAPPTKDNYKDKIFNAMLRAEKEHEAFVAGSTAPYVRVQVRGMEFDEKHYWPPPNPYLRRDLREEDIPRRRFRSVAMGETPMQLYGELGKADFVVYYIEESRVNEEPQWQNFLTQQCFKLVDRFYDPRFGSVPARYFAVFARDFTGSSAACSEGFYRSSAFLSGIRRADDIDQLDIFELALLTEHPRFSTLSDLLQRYAVARLNGLAQRFPAQTMNRYASFVTADIRKMPVEPWYEFRFLFYCDNKMDQDWRVYFLGRVRKEDIPRLPENFRKRGFMDWNFDPIPPTSEWTEKHFIVVTQRCDVPPLKFWMDLGFFDPDLGYLGNPVTIELDFSELGRTRSEQKT